MKQILQLQLTNGELNEKVSEALKKEYGKLDYEINIEKIEDLIYVEKDTYEFFIECASVDEEKNIFYFFTYWVKCKLINKNEIEITEASLAV